MLVLKLYEVPQLLTNIVLLKFQMSLFLTHLPVFLSTPGSYLRGSQLQEQTGKWWTVCPEMPDDKMVFVCVSNLGNNSNNNNIEHLEVILKFKIHSVSDASSLCFGRIQQQNIFPVLNASFWLTSRFPLSHRVVSSQTAATKLAWDAALVPVGLKVKGWTCSICLLM